MGGKKTSRPKPGWEHELRAGHPVRVIAGVDEVGRGCLAGPVVAGAVVLPDEIDSESHPWILEITDSKLLSPEKREELAPLIHGWARAWGIALASVEEIDRINIHAASHLAMYRALEAMKLKASHILIDGKFLPKDLPCPGTAIIKGDQKCLSIACASIIAKVWRDRHMADLEARYPGYEFAQHKGYSTPTHARALKALGACREHRRSFAPVREAIERSQAAGKPAKRKSAGGERQRSLFE